MATMQRFASRAPRRLLLSVVKPRMPSPFRAFPVRALSTTTALRTTTNTMLADAFQLLPESQKPGVAEDALYEATVSEIQAWWASPRYKGIKRPYSAADVASKRGSQKTLYPSSVMATKFFNLIREREANGEPIHTSKHSNFPDTCHVPSLTPPQWAPSTPSR